MHLVAEHCGGHGATDQRGRDVVEKTRNHEHQHQQHEAAFPVIRQIVRQHGRHIAVFKMFGEQRETEQQPEQVGERDPLVAEVQQQALDTGAGFEAGDAELVERDEDQAAGGYLEGLVVKQRDAKQHAGEENEIKRHRAERDDVGRPACRRGGRRGCRRGRRSGRSGSGGSSGHSGHSSGRQCRARAQ